LLVSQVLPLTMRDPAPKTSLLHKKTGYRREIGGLAVPIIDF
jgi:hypothetical protein